MPYQQILFGVALLCLVFLALRGISIISVAIQAKGYHDGLHWSSCLLLAPVVALMMPAFIGIFWRGETLLAKLVTLASSPIGILVASTAAKYLIDRHLPEAVRKPPGRSRFPFALCGFVSAAFIVIRPVTTFNAGKGFLSAIASAYVPAGAAVLFFGLAARASAKSVTQEVKADPRPPVLYIRPFAKEGYVFANTPRSALARRLSIFEESSFDSPIGNSSNKTFGAFFQEAIRQKVGPFISLGSPWDRFPRIDGPSREYCADNSWQQRYAELVDGAAIVLASIETSDNLCWELTYLRRAGLASKLFLCTPPKSDPRLNSFLKVFARGFGCDSIDSSGLRPPSWPATRRALEESGYAPPEQFPGPGALLASTLEGTLKVIVTGARTPEEYIEAILKHQRDANPGLRQMHLDF